MSRTPTILKSAATALFVIFFAVFQGIAQHSRLNILLITGVGITGPDHMYHDWSHAHYNEILQAVLKDVADVTITED